MENNIYQPPASDVGVGPSDSEFSFYVVSVKKFTTLFFATVGVYSIYWFYQNWTNYKRYKGSSIWPVPRAIFNIFFTHSLVTAINDEIETQQKKFKWSPSLLATGYVIAAIISSILDSASGKDIGSPYTDILSLLTVPVSYVLLLKIQKAINFSQNDVDGSANSHFSAANIVWIVIGAFWWCLVLFGLAAIYLEGVSPF